jgi:iron(III) transport system ATP-binding protein
MADRVVVMNQGAIEQVGTPSDVYERPETPFVADFLGKVNVLKATALGGGRYRVGTIELNLPVDGNAAGDPVRIYLRPEDRHVEGEIGDRPNRLRGRIARIDYLGTMCLAELRCEALGQPMTIAYSLNQLHDLQVREGGEVEIALRTDRVRVFPEQARA